MGILENGMATRRIAVYFVAGALLSMTAMLPRAAVARIHNCEHASLLPEDAERLAQVAQHVLPPHREIMLAERCRRSDSAFAWVTTAKVIGENGVAQWWMASCSRDARNWACEPGVLHQEIEKSIDVGGVSRQVKIRFDGETNIETVENLTSEAVKIYVGTTGLPFARKLKVKKRRRAIRGRVTRCLDRAKKSKSPSVGRRIGFGWGSVASCVRATSN